jgi:hypothetical protein
MQRATVPPGLLLGGVRCAILWASVLLVSAALAYAINAAITAGVSAGGTHVGGDPAAPVAEQPPAEGRTFSDRRPATITTHAFRTGQRSYRTDNAPSAVFHKENDA